MHMNSLKLSLGDYCELLRCPSCLQTFRNFIDEEDRLTCTSCNKHYPIVDGLPILLNEINQNSMNLVQTKRVTVKKKLKQSNCLKNIIWIQIGSLKRMILHPLSQIKLLYYMVYCALQLRCYPGPVKDKKKKDLFFNYYYDRCLWKNLPGHLILKLFEGYCYQDTEIKSHCLEIGPGGGTTTMLNFHGKDLTFGLEYFGDNITNNTRNLFKMVVVGGISPIPFGNQTLATILAVHIIDHILNIDDLLEEIVRVLKPGGRFIFTTNGSKYPFLKYHPFRPKTLDVANQWELKMFNSSRPGGFPLLKSDNPEDAIGQNNYTKNEWEEIAKKHGLKVSQYKEFICGPNAKLFTLLWLHSVKTRASMTGIFGQIFTKKLVKRMFFADETFSDQGGLEIYLELEKLKG